MRVTILGAAVMGTVMTALMAGTSEGQTKAAGFFEKVDTTASFQVEKTNTATGQCGCFWMRGGGMDVAYEVSPRFSLVAAVHGGTAKAALGTTEGLTLVSYLGGVRVYQKVWRESPKETHTPRLFLEALAGAEHAGGGIAAVADGTYNLSMRFGGGLDVQVDKSKVYVRLPHLDYSYTRFANGVDQHQNDFVVSAGVGYGWGR